MGWDVLLGAVVPALAPLIAIVLMFDVLMCWVRKTDSEDPEEIARFGFAIKAHSLIAVILFLAWMTAFSDALVI